MDKKNNDKEKMVGEDATQYGEFISTFHQWIPPEEQKKRAKKLEDATNKDLGYRKRQ